MTKYRMPAEWEAQASVWLSWPHNTDTWSVHDGKYAAMLGQYAYFVATLSQHQLVHINVPNKRTQEEASNALLTHTRALMENVQFHYIPTNDAWCRDHGPIFVYRESDNQKIALDWGYNAWGGKYPPFDLDNEVPRQVAQALSLPSLTPGIILEGGSVEVNGKGLLITTSSCLLNKNRNPSLSKHQIEQFLQTYLGGDHIYWLQDGIIGDDTDGHIDDITRFYSETGILTVLESNAQDENYDILKHNLKEIQSWVHPITAKKFSVVEIPMPSPLIVDGLRLPASYANYLVTNHDVLVPVFDDKHDLEALNTIRQLFPSREVIGIPAQHIVWGLGTLHCLSQQEPI